MKAEGLSGASRLRSGERWLRRRLIEPDWPTVAVEIRPNAVSVVRLVRDGDRLALGAAASLDLPAGTLDVSLARTNAVDGAALRKALASAFERAGALSGGPVGLVIPDPAVRVALLPAAEVKGVRRSDVQQMIRFRLSKALPFDVRDAEVAWAGPVDGQVLVSAVFRPVLEGYESALADLGFDAGVVEPSSLALVGTLERAAAPGDRLLFNWDVGYVSIVLTRGGWPVLIRTLAGDLGADTVMREAANTVLYYRERLGGQGLVSAAVRSVLVPPEEAVTLLRGPLGLVPVILDPWAPLGGGEGGSSAQALAGALACLLRSAL